MKQYFAWYVNDWYYDITETIEIWAENDEQAEEMAEKYDYKRWDGPGKEPFDWIGLQVVSADRAKRAANGLYEECIKKVKEAKEGKLR